MVLRRELPHRLITEIALDPGATSAGHLVRRALGETCWPEVFELAVRHGLAGALWRAVEAAGAGDRPEVADTRRESRRTALRAVRVLTDLRAVADLLDGAQLPWAVVKGPALSELVYEDPRSRTSVDLDVVVSPRDFEAAVEVLEEAGFAVLERNWPVLRGAGAAQLRLRAPSGGLVDLHWHLVNDPELRAVFPLDWSFVQAGLRRRPLAGLAVPVLRPSFALVHLAVHSATAGGDRMVWLTDLQRTIAAGQVDWDELCALASSTRTGLVVGLMLARAERALGPILPRGLERRLSPMWLWRLLSRGVDTVSPIAASRREGSLARLVARAARDSPSRSVAVGLWSALDWLRYGPQNEARAGEALYDASDPRSTSYEAGGPEDRSGYFSDVAAGYRPLLS